MPEWMVTWLGWIAAALVSVVAIRASIRFDLNEWLRDRTAQKEKNLRMLCPHADFSNENGKVLIRPTYVSPPGTTAWQCQMCGHITHDDAWVDNVMKYWASHPDELSERNKKMLREAKKLGRL